MQIYTNEPTFINIADIWDRAFRKSKSLAYSRALMWMSRRGSSPHGKAQSTHGEKREKHTSSPQQHRKGTKALSILAIVNAGESKEHLPVFPVLLNSSYLGYQDHSIPANPALVLSSQTTFFVPECLLWARTFLFCYGNVIHLDIIHVVDMQDPR